MANYTLLDSINGLASASSTMSAEADISHFFARTEASQQHALQELSQHPAGKALLENILVYSPHLSRLIERHGDFFIRLCEEGVAATYADFQSRVLRYDPAGIPRSAVMRALRIFKNELSLLSAIADIHGQWPLEAVTGALAEFAGQALHLCSRTLLLEAVAKSELAGLPESDPERASGIIILGLGKLGGQELNYSSDIDIMLLYHPERLNYTGKRNLQHFLTRMAQDIVTMMQERTPDGYVFRTDLRLRPDPSSTPPAVSVPAAMAYYESVGQNWERAALIKARPVAGDIVAGEEFLAGISPFIWRKHLDFAAIADIQSIKRQMTPQRDHPITLPHHNIKTGRGGIREIEFLAQIYQLIWGGRMPPLRLRATCDVLAALAEAGIIPRQQQIELTESYRFLRQVEHRLQMSRDQQTHTIPEAEDGRKSLAGFLGYHSLKDFEKELLWHLERVHRHYREAFSGEMALGGSGSLSFTGVELDPETLETLRQMGFSQPETVASQIMAWHHGKRRATRSKRARELITELTPELLRQFSMAANPDQAFLRFDEFVAHLPAGVQLFSLFAAHPKLLELIAVIMGSAPALAEKLAHSPDLLDVVLTSDFYSALEIQLDLSNLLRTAHAYEDRLALLRRFKNEQSFLIGVQLIRQQITLQEAAQALTRIAEMILQALQEMVQAEFEKSYGTIPGGALSILALGRLGAESLTFGSDLDLVFVYTTSDPEARSDGNRSFSASVYYNRLCQRIIGALTAMDRGGALYEVDTRLRPSGKDGSLAVSIEGFDSYFSTLAWTFEFMALTRARVVSGPEKLRARLGNAIRQHLLQPRDAGQLAADVHGMRQKVEAEFTTSNPWNVKYMRGGLMELEFISQYLVLRYAHRYPALLGMAESDAFMLLAKQGELAAERVEILCRAAHFFNAVLAVLRLCGSSDFVADQAPEGLKRLLLKLLAAKDFASLEKRLLQEQAQVAAVYSNLIAEIRPSH